MSARGVSLKEPVADSPKTISWQQRFERSTRIVLALFVLLIAGVWASHAFCAVQPLSTEDSIESEFAEELFVPEDLDAREIQSAVDGTVVGLTLSSNAEDSFTEIANAMEARGWRVISSGMGTAGSFVKSEGSIRWAFVSCTQIGLETSVVVQIAGDEQ